MYKKGQYFSFDAIIASVIFIMAIVLLISYWHSVKTFLDYQTSDVTKESMRIASLLFIPAFPEGADCSTLENIGFANNWDDRRIREDLLECSSLQSTEWLKEKVGTPYNISIKITYVDNDYWFTIGDAVIPSEAIEVSNMRRAASVVNDTGGTRLAYVDISVYR